MGATYFDDWDDLKARERGVNSGRRAGKQGQKLFDAAVETFRADVRCLKFGDSHKSSVEILVPLRDACREYLGTQGGDHVFYDLITEALK